MGTQPTLSNITSCANPVNNPSQHPEFTKAASFHGRPRRCRGVQQALAIRRFAEECPAIDEADKQISPPASPTPHGKAQPLDPLASTKSRGENRALRKSAGRLVIKVDHLEPETVAQGSLWSKLEPLLPSSPATRAVAIEALKEDMENASSSGPTTPQCKAVHAVSRGAMPMAPRTAPPGRRLERTQSNSTLLKRSFSAKPYRGEEMTGVSPRTRRAQLILPPLANPLANSTACAQLRPVPPDCNQQRGQGLSCLPDIAVEMGQGQEIGRRSPGGGGSEQRIGRRSPGSDRSSPEAGRVAGSLAAGEPHRSEEGMEQMHEMIRLVLGRLAVHLNAVVCGRLATTCVGLRGVLEEARKSRSRPPILPRLPHCDLQGPQGPARLPILSTVLCTILTKDGRLCSQGSGAVLRDHEGWLHVVTAAHVVVSRTGSFDATKDSTLTILIAITDSVTQAPRHSFQAFTRPEMVDTLRDIAVLSLSQVVCTRPECGITGTNGKLVSQIEVVSRIPLLQGPRQLPELHVLELGDVRQVQVMEKLMLYGYPLTGSDTITTSEASCCGFTAQNGQVMHMKLHGLIDNGFSGGPVVSMQDGKVVGTMSYSKGHVDYAVPIGAAIPLMAVARG